MPRGPSPPPRCSKSSPMAASKGPGAPLVRFHCGARWASKCLRPRAPRRRRSRARLPRWQAQPRALPRLDDTATPASAHGCNVATQRRCRARPRLQSLRRHLRPCRNALNLCRARGGRADRQSRRARVEGIRSLRKRSFGKRSDRGTSSPRASWPWRTPPARQRRHVLTFLTTAATRSSRVSNRVTGSCSFLNGTRSAAAAQRQLTCPDRLSSDAIGRCNSRAETLSSPASHHNALSRDPRTPSDTNRSATAESFPAHGATRGGGGRYLLRRLPCCAG
jgi:hypothetical protein